MNERNLSLKNSIIAAALPHVPFDGWTISVLKRAACDAGYDAAMISSVFPSGISDAVRHFAVMVDQALGLGFGGCAPGVVAEVDEAGVGAVLGRGGGGGEGREGEGR